MRTKMIRWLKRLLIYGTIMFILGMILFAIFIANPFESNYSGTLAELTIADAVATVHLPDSPSTLQNLQKVIAWKKVRNHPNYQLLQREKWFQKLQQQFQEIAKLEKQIGFEFFQEKYLWYLLGNEIFWEVSTYENLKKQSQEEIFLLSFRIQFLLKIVEGISSYAPYFSLPVSIGFENAITMVTLPQDKKIYFYRHRDVLSISNDLHRIRLARKKLQGQSTESSRLQSYSAPSGAIKFHLNATWLDQKIASERKLARLWQKIQRSNYLIDLKKVSYYLGHLHFFSGLQLSLALSHPEKPRPYYQQLYQLESRAPKDLIASLPASTFAITKVTTLPDKLWQQWQPVLMQKLDHQSKAWLARLEQEYQTQDIVQEFVIDYLQPPVFVTTSTLPYIRADLEPLDPYPAFSLFLATDNPQELYHNLAKVLQAEWQKSQLDVLELRKRSYGNREYLQLDLKGLDFTSGALRPVISWIPGYVVISSHELFFHSICDVRDKIARKFEQSLDLIAGNHSHFWEKISQKNYIFLEFAGIIRYIYATKTQWANEIALEKVIENPSGPSKEVIQRKVLKQINKYLQLAQTFRYQAELEISQNLEQSQINFHLWWKLR